MPILEDPAHLKTHPKPKKKLKLKTVLETSNLAKTQENAC